MNSFNLDALIRGIQNSTEAESFIFSQTLAVK